jgi:hypothetical protein
LKNFNREASCRQCVDLFIFHFCRFFGGGEERENFWREKMYIVESARAILAGKM